MDYGKFKYESALKARESRKNQAQTVIKEIKLRPKIDPHDYGTKKGHVERFLKAGDKVKVTIMFRGREQSRPELGFRLLQRLAGDVEELGFVEAQPKQDGRNMTMVIGPHRRKSDARAERPVHAQAERSHPERPERSPQAHRGPQAPPAPAQPAQDRPAPAQPAQAEPAQAAQPAPARPAPAQPAQAAARAARPSPHRLSLHPLSPLSPRRPSPHRLSLHPLSPRPPSLRLSLLRSLRNGCPPPGRFPARAPYTPPRPGGRTVARGLTRAPGSQARKSRPADRKLGPHLTHQVAGAGPSRPGAGLCKEVTRPRARRRRRRRRPCRR